jgi:putative hydrolase of the HAD superfamily
MRRASHVRRYSPSFLPDSSPVLPANVEISPQGCWKKRPLWTVSASWYRGRHVFSIPAARCPVPVETCRIGAPRNLRAGCRPVRWIIIQTFKTLFVDLGGCLLTNGWDRHARARAAEVFNLDHDEMDERHNLTFGAWEAGRIDLATYLRRVIFYTQRSFTPENFTQFLFEQSRTYEDVIDFVRDLKVRHGLHVVAITNDPRELVEHRVKAFNLREFIDIIVASCFVHYRKPDYDIYRIAIDVAQAAPSESVYLEDREMFVEVGREVGLTAVRHIDLETTRAALAELGLN